MLLYQFEPELNWVTGNEDLLNLNKKFTGGYMNYAEDSEFKKKLKFTTLYPDDEFS